jgi:NADPH:quinone reductase-like Zn-dependent oxidoreductase
MDGKLRRMRAAVIERYGELPVLREVPEPKAEGVGLVEVSAAALNPADLAIAGGKFYAGSPPTPYVPGMEGVGRPLQNGGLGPRAFFRAMLPNGSLAERAVARDEPVPIPDGVPDGVAAALGTSGFPAYLGLTKLAQLQKGETVLILAASGVLGTIAVQLARLLGAARVIAAARDERALVRAKELGADATIDLKQADGLTERIREASGGQLQVVLDPLWGIPGAAALEALSPHGRFVQVGASAGNEALIKSGSVRGRDLSILGFSTFLEPWEELAAAYRQLVAYAAAGKIKVDFEVLPLESAAEAWKQQASSPHRKLVISPQAGR